MYTVWEAFRKYHKLTLISLETLRNRRIAMDEGNYLGLSMYLVKTKIFVSCALHYVTQQLRVEGGARSL